MRKKRHVALRSYLSLEETVATLLYFVKLDKCMQEPMFVE